MDQAQTLLNHFGVPSHLQAYPDKPNAALAQLEQYLRSGKNVVLSVNAQIPDGRDTSWLWDVDYRVLRGRRVFVTGERRMDLAVRLEADEVPFELAEGIDDAVDRVTGGSLDVIANYTAFQQIRTALGRAA